ncbi:MAG: shikimate dehydrogenase [Candidatus Bathyarchaeota archaeon]|nr:shikimate dehydrogenase [Candidatus Bathyarchaeota archaeon]
MDVSGKTRVYGVIGDPIEHTLSPTLQNAAFEASELDCVFLAFPVKTGQVKEALDGMRALEICGLNVTMPHKNAVIAYLDEIQEEAKFLKAVNTIHNQNGKLQGYNTDGVGAVNALKENGADPKGKRVLLLGAGGAARAIAFALTKEASEIVVLNRTESQATELANALTEATKKKISSDTLSSESLKGHLPKADILINATSVGMKPALQSPAPANLLKPDSAVMDIVYNPVETQLAKDAKATGAKVVSGVEMLIYQGAAAFEIWTGQSAPVDVMRKAALNHLQKVQI